MADTAWEAVVTKTKKDFDSRQALKREILRILDENRATICRRAATPENALLASRPDQDKLNKVYAEFDNLFDSVFRYLQSQDF